MTGTDSRFSIRGQSRLRILVPPLLAILALAALLFSFDDFPGEAPPRDDDLCPVDREAIASRAVFLFDFTKPLDLVEGALPGDLLRNVTRNLGRDTELQVFSLTGSPSAPRARLQRLCKPYANVGLGPDESGDRGEAADDCGNLPVELTGNAHQSAISFCAARDALISNLNAAALADWPEDDMVANAYLVEAFEDIRLEFAERPGPHRLYIFSDMVQHTPWYSHLDLEWTDWNYSEFVESLESRNWFFLPEESTDTQVEVFYVPRGGTTDQPLAKERHQHFWRSYFAGATLTFHDQPPMPGYTAVPLTNVLTDAAAAAQERAAIERLLLEIQQEQEALDREYRELKAQGAIQAEAQRRRLAERQAELDRDLEAAADRQQAEQEAQAQHEPERTIEQRDAEPAVAQSQPEAPMQQSTPPRLPPCALAVRDDVGVRHPDYPRAMRRGRFGRLDLGDARIAVRYAVDEFGETIDDEVTLVEAHSRADRKEYFNLFVQTALRSVRSWAYSFVDPTDETCSKHQTHVTSFQFSYD